MRRMPGGARPAERAGRQRADAVGRGAQEPARADAITRGAQEPVRADAIARAAPEPSGRIAPGPSGGTTRLGPRVVIAGTHSGVGKTTIATGVMAALRRAGASVASANVGPDFIDPGFHALATGRPPRNLDAWICGSGALGSLAARAGDGADILVVEGVMGLFDGVGAGLDASTAAVAAAIGAPVVLVVDAAAMSGSVAAVVHGFHTLDPGVPLAGVILNRVGGPGHAALLRSALEPLAVPVLGVLQHDADLAWRDRHLGLVPVAEDRTGAQRAVSRLADAVAAGVDLAAVERVARSAPSATVPALGRARRVGRATVAVATGPAFSFMYPDNIERLEEAGAEIVAFDPAADERLPSEADAMVVGGGFPEVYVESLSANEALLGDVRSRIAGGLVTWAECGGLLWLCRSLDGRPMVGALDATATMAGAPTLGYRQATARSDSPLAAAGSALRGHEYHCSSVTPPGDALELAGTSAVSRAGTSAVSTAGFARPSLLASYLHLHLGADPAPAERFVATAARRPTGS